MSEEKALQTAQGNFSLDPASHYERQMQSTRGDFVEITQRLIEAAGIREGSQVLDLAAGTGEQTIPAARAAGSTGTVLATDVSSDMLKKLELFAEQEGLTNIKTQNMNAEHLTLADQTFDAIISRFALNYLDYRKVLSEAQRVLRPKRKIAMLIWSTLDRLPLVSIQNTIILKYTEMTSYPDELAASGVFEQELKRAGFSEVTVQPMSIHPQFPSLDVFFELFITVPVAIALEQLSQEDRRHALEEMRQAMRRFQRPDGTLVLPSKVLLGVGTRRE
jgi:ubiquinone/menaquinone biosynthesis C-methylase UbiE